MPARARARAREPETRVELPVEYRLAPLGNVNEDARTVDVTWTTGAAVRRRDWFTGEEWDEVLVVNAEAVDMSRLQNGAPVLDAHRRWSLDGVIGVVERAWIEGDKGKATIRFPAKGLRAESDEILGLIRDRIIQNVSVGYATSKAEWDRKGEVPIRRAVRWQPHEISFVPVGADAGAGTRAGLHACEISEKETTMPLDNNRDSPGTDPAPGTQATPQPTPQPAPATPAAVDEAAIRGAAVAAERTRAATIRSRMRAAGLPDDVADRHVASGLTVENLNPVITDELAARGTGQPIRTPPNGLDETETVRAGVAEAILNRYNATLFPLTDKGRPWRGMRGMEIGRELLHIKGEITRGLAPMQLAERALHTTSDFPLIIANVANKTLQAGYAAEVRTFLPFCTRNDLPDFKLTQSTMLGEGSDLDLVPESGEFTSGTVGEGAESWQLLTYGKIIGFTRQLLINDDMGAFTRVPYMFGQAGARKENDIVWGILTANANMSDGVALFAAGHTNLQTGGGSVLALASLATMRTNLRKMKGLDSKQTLNLVLRYIMIPAILETALEQILSPLLYASQTSNTVPAFYRGLQPIVEARLDASSTTAFYGACDPGQMPTIDYGYLQGQEGVFLETKEGWRVDGVEVKVRHDFGAKAVNHRGLQKSNGV